MNGVLRGLDLDVAGSGGNNGAQGGSGCTVPNDAIYRLNEKIVRAKHTQVSINGGGSAAFRAPGRRLSVGPRRV